MRFDYHDLYDLHFERLVVEICSEILGPSVSPFSDGPDGGRDARFSGTATCHPNASHPLTGKFVVQAKHTNDPIAKFSEAGFGGDAASSVLSEEIPKIKKLVDRGELDHYLLFTNRRLSAGSEETIRNRIVKETGAKTVELFGIERIDLLLRRFSCVEERAELPAFKGPLLVTPDDLAAVIVALDQSKGVLGEVARDPEFVRNEFARKNERLGVRQEFAKMITRNFLPVFPKVKEFLEHPENEEVLESYLAAKCEFQEKVAAHRDEFDSFERLMSRILDVLIKRDPDLKSRTRTTRIVFYYMYWICDLGGEE